MTRDVAEVAGRIEARLRAAGIKLTLGGEPTYVPVKPEGAEWQFLAVGPTKKRFAYALADALIADELPGAITIFSPGKSYPGEVNPRWVVNLLWNRAGPPLLPPSIGPKTARSAPGRNDVLDHLKARISRALKLPASAWLRARETRSRAANVRVLALDYDADKGRWRTERWKFHGIRAGAAVPLIDAEGPAGLRLPLGLLPPDALRRGLTLERNKDGLVQIFLPPLLEAPWAELLAHCITALAAAGVNAFRFAGYVPTDETGRWCRLGLTADPGVLEVNLPPCDTWANYARWLQRLERAGERVGLRSYKEISADADKTEPPAQAGTGGGNHLLFGGPRLEENPFFTRPAWVASLLRYFQAHPSLAYLFTGHYVGPSSQAPRADESARDLFDLDLAYRHLADQKSGEDHRALIGETLRHLHVDVSGNTHRSEISFDKFWNVNGPPGSTAGLIEFRAIESLPRADWMALVALLWRAIALHTLERGAPATLVPHGKELHDAFFLPTYLWADLEAVLGDLARRGLRLSAEGFREIWNWRFPLLLRAEIDAGTTVMLEIRRACEGWPLLSETPAEGGTTSRFVDTSMDRLELTLHGAGFAAGKHRVFANGRELRLDAAPGTSIASGCGLRYRRTAFYPSLHPGIAPQLPLEIAVTDRRAKKKLAVFRLAAAGKKFERVSTAEHALDLDYPCLKSDPTLLTYDLRLGNPAGDGLKKVTD